MKLTHPLDRPDREARTADAPPRTHAPRLAGWGTRPDRDRPTGEAEASDRIPCTRAAADHWLR